MGNAQSAIMLLWTEITPTRHPVRLIQQWVISNSASVVHTTMIGLLYSSRISSCPLRCTVMLRHDMSEISAHQSYLTTLSRLFWAYSMASLGRHFTPADPP